MTPITHGFISWIAATPLKHRKDRILVTIAGLVPDIDGVGAIISVDYYAKFHHILAHNIFFGIIISIMTLLISGQKKLTVFLALLSFHLHLICDLFGSGAGWGVQYFWPINNINFEFKAPFQWELDSLQNLVITAVSIAIMIFISLKKNRTILEVINLKLDMTVVSVFKKWFKRS